MKKLIPGGKYKTRPSASYFLHTLRAPLGHEVVYRKKKGGPMIKHTLQMKKGKGGKPVPYWKPVEGQKHSIRKSIRRSARRKSTRRSNRRRSTKRRSVRRSNRRRSTRRSNRRRSTRRRSRQRGGSCKIERSTRDSCHKTYQYGG